MSANETREAAAAMSALAAEKADVICDHAGPCPPKGRGCRWVQFEREYTSCECGGWSERWVSRNKSVRLAGRTNHRRSCVPTGGAA